MVLAKNTLQMAISMSEIIIMGSLMVMDSIIGQMVLCFKVSLRMDYGMVKEFALRIMMDKRVSILENM